MAPAQRVAIAVMRWGLALAMVPLIVAPFLLLSLLFAGWGLSQFGVDQDTDKVLAIPVYGVIFALASFMSICFGTTIAPHRYWKLTIGILTIGLIVPIAAVLVPDILISGDTGYGGSGVGEIGGVVVGAFLAYRALRRQRGARVDTPALSKRVSVAILAACAVLLLLPFRSVTVPLWRVQFVDVAGEPLAGLKISQTWTDYSVEGQSVGSKDIGTTDTNGFVVFPERVLWAPLAQRLWRPMDNLLRYFLHSSFGVHAELRPLCPLRAVEPDGIYYYAGASLAVQLHLREEDHTSGPSDLTCQRLLDQVGLAQSPH